MKHENNNYKIINDLAFSPYEDFLGIGLDGGIFNSNLNEKFCL